MLFEKIVASKYKKMIAMNRDLSQLERTTKYGKMDDLVRFSFGVEDFDDLKADIFQALETI